METPWQRGTRIAHIARQVWNLSAGPVRTSTLSDLVGADLAPATSEAGLPFSAGLRDDGSEGFRVCVHPTRLTGRRFALAKLMSDHIVVSGGERLLPATKASTSRQKFQRSFAQEFLCPIDDLREFLGSGAIGDDDVQDAADHFEVSPLTIKTTLVNKGDLPRDALGEWAV